MSRRLAADCAYVGRRGQGAKARWIAGEDDRKLYEAICLCCGLLRPRLRCTTLGAVMILCLRVAVAALLSVSALPSSSWAQQPSSRPPSNLQLNIYSYGQGAPYGTPYGSPQPYNGVNNLPDTDGSTQQNSRLPSDSFLDTMRPARRY